MHDYNGAPESQLEMVRLLASIQASQKFMSDTLVEIKDDVRETKEATQGHALQIASVKTDVEVLRTRLNNTDSLLVTHIRSCEAPDAKRPKTGFEAIGIFGGLAGLAYGLIEVLKMLINYFTYHAKTP